MTKLIQLTGLAMAIWVGAQLTACAHTPSDQPADGNAQAAGATARPPTGPSMEAKQVAAEEQAPYVTELGFRKGKRSLSAADQSKLNRVIADAKAHGKIDEVRVISWADEEYPSVHTKKLSSNQRKLADGRNSEIKDYIHGIDGGANVESYNMAERPGALSEMFSTSNARVKKALEVAGIPTTDSGVKMPAKASKAIVLVIMKE